VLHGSDERASGDGCRGRTKGRPQRELVPFETPTALLIVVPGSSR
jgi:hypothetical protein